LGIKPKLVNLHVIKLNTKDKEFVLKLINVKEDEYIWKNILMIYKQKDFMVDFKMG